MKHILKKENIVLIFSIILITTFILSVDSYRNKIIATYPCIDINSNCEIYINDVKQDKLTTKDINLKFLNKGDTVKLTTIIPEIDISNPILTLYNKNNSVIVTYDNNVIFNNSSSNKNSIIYGMSVIDIPLDNSFANKNLTVEITLCDTSLSGKLSPITIMNSYDNSRKFIMKNIFSIFLSISATIAGFISIILLYYYVGFNKSVKNLFLIALITINVSLLFTSAFSITSIIIDNSSILYISLFNFSFILITLLTFFVLSNHNNIKLLKLSFIFNIIYAAISNLLQYWEIAYLSELFNIYLLIYLIPFVFYFINTSKKILKKYKDNELNLTQLITIIISFICVVVFLLTYFITSSDQILYCLYLVTLFIIGKYVFNFFYNQTNSYRIKMEKQSLITMAYKDLLTGINNRRATERYIKEKYEQNIEKCGVFSFDLDNLKYVNDNFGHMAGDNIIKKFADALKMIDLFSFCARNGGDEYMAFVENPDDTTKTIILLQLNRIVDLFNMEINDNYKIEFSVGYSVFDKNKHLDIYDSISEADQDMYAQKEKKKKNK